MNDAPRRLDEVNEVQEREVSTYFSCVRLSVDDVLIEELSLVIRIRSHEEHLKVNELLFPRDTVNLLSDRDDRVKMTSCASAGE